MTNSKNLFIGLGLLAFVIVTTTSFASATITAPAAVTITTASATTIHGGNGPASYSRCPRVTQFHNCNPATGHRTGHCKLNGRWHHRAFRCY